MSAARTTCTYHLRAMGPPSTTPPPARPAWPRAPGGRGRWLSPPVDEADDDGLVGVGADLEPSTILSAYRQGLFPMPLGRRGPIGWWSPDPRAVIPLDGLRVSRSLRR